MRRFCRARSLCLGTSKIQVFRFTIAMSSAEVEDTHECQIPPKAAMILLVHIANRIKNDTIKANSPVASANANPKIAYPNNCPVSDGFRATPLIKAPKTVPMPVPAPMSPAAAAPAPISLPAPRMAAPIVMVSVATPRDWLRAMTETALRSMALLLFMRRPELRVAGWNRVIELVGPD